MSDTDDTPEILYTTDSIATWRAEEDRLTAEVEVEYQWEAPHTSWWRRLLCQHTATTTYRVYSTDGHTSLSLTWCDDCGKRGVQ